MSLRRGFQRVWLSYNNSLAKRPYLVPSLQTSFLLGLGDIIAQNLIEDSSPYEYVRTIRFAGIGLFLGPGLTVWYRVLDKFIGSDKGIKSSLKKVAIDQCVFSPAMMVVFMGTFSALQGASFAQFKDNLEKNYVDILLNNYKVWPAVQILNFSIVPLQFRVLVVQVVALGWNTYLAWKLHN